MSTWHRDNPDSEECQRMERDNRIAVEIAKMQTCIRCGRIIPPDAIYPHGRCDDCEYEGRAEEAYIEIIENEEPDR